MAKKSVLTSGKKVQADLAAKDGDLARAQALFANVCKLDPMDTEAWTKLSLVEKRLGNFVQAERYARRAVLLNPRLGFAHFVLGQALHSQEQRAAAMECYRLVLRLMPDFSDAYYLLGLAQHEQGSLAEAVASLEQAVRLRPDFAQALAELGAVFIDSGQVDRGLVFLRRVAELRPYDPVVLGNISHAMRLQGDHQVAIDGFRQALTLAPDNVDLMTALAGTLEKSGQIEEAQGLVLRGLNLMPHHEMANLVAAQLERRALRLQQAAERLQALLQPELPAAIYADIALELGQIYDQMGDAERAYPLIVAGKRSKALATLNQERHEGRKAYLHKIARVRHMANSALATKLREALGRNDMDDLQERVPVFLIGFPRSGTTLLEQILDSHPGLQVMEEKPAVSRMVECALQWMDAQQCTLTDLSDEQLTELRKCYFTEVAQHLVLQPGHLLLDKLPLNTVFVPVIARVFPRAKFILELRHPCDVCLSCMMQSFAINDAMANFYSIQDSAKFYAEVMGAWLEFSNHLPLNFHTIRYEDLINDVPSRSREILEFLGLAWDDTVLSHTEHARQRSAINTPSYHQVVQPIYQRSKFRWKRYEDQLAQVLPVLQPFIEKFAYQ